MGAAVAYFWRSPSDGARPRRWRRPESGREIRKAGGKTRAAPGEQDAASNQSTQLHSVSGAWRRRRMAGAVRMCAVTGSLCHPLCLERTELAWLTNLDRHL